MLGIEPLSAVAISSAEVAQETYTWIPVNTTQTTTWTEIAA